MLGPPLEDDSRPTKKKDVTLKDRSIELPENTRKYHAEAEIFLISLISVF